MKTISIFGIFAAFLTISFSLPAKADFNGYQISPCQFWMPSNNGGYVCQNIPPRITVPQAQSLAELLKKQNSRIEELEKKVAELQTLLKNTSGK